MVNGQVLVNNWTDHTSTMNSGTVTLQANTKYDIRLEYYRNATNSSVVKLEWQSASRARQVVPTGNLFPTNLDGELYWKDLKLALNLNFQVDTQLATINKSDTRIGFIIPIVGENSTITAVKVNGKWSLARELKMQNGTVAVSNLLTNRSVDFGVTSNYKTMTKLQKWQLERQLYPGLEQKVYPLNASRPSNSNRAVPSDLCPICLAKFESYAVELCRGHKSI